MENNSGNQTNQKDTPTPSTTFSTDTAFSQYQTSPNALANVAFTNLWSPHNNPTNQMNINPFNPLQNNFPSQPIKNPHSLLSSPTATSFSSPQANNMMTENPSNTRQEGSDRKRSRRSLVDDSALEDIMGQITSKLNSLSTGEESQKEHSIHAFIEVLGCNWNEAEFYLESTTWDIQTAVVLWLENNPTTNSWSRQGTVSAPRWNTQPRFRDQIVIIEGLDSDRWTARVDPLDGCIYFYNNSTGIRQQQVPAGFADLPAPSKQARMGVHPGMFDDDLIDEDNQRDDDDTEIEIVNEGNPLDRESTIFSTQSEGNQQSEEDGNDIMMHDQGGEGLQIPLYGNAMVETHVFGSHSEYWKESLPMASTSLDGGRVRRNNSDNELYEQNNKDIDEDELD